MESIENLKENIRKLTIERDSLELQVSNLLAKIKADTNILDEAKMLHDTVPRDFFVTNAAEAFLVGEKELEIINLLDDKSIRKFLEHSLDLTIDENNDIFLGKKLIGTAKDESLKTFLKELVPVLPYMFKIYTRYYHFSNLCLDIDIKYNYLGKNFQQKMQGEEL